MFEFFFFKQKTAYEMRISDWSSDVCSSDLRQGEGRQTDRPSRNRRRRRKLCGATRRRAQTLCRPLRIGDCRKARIGLAREAQPEARRRSEERRVGKECGGTCRSRW